MQNIITAYGIAYQVSKDEMVWRADRDQTEGLLIRIEGCPVANNWEIVANGHYLATHDSLDAAQRAVSAAVAA